MAVLMQESSGSKSVHPDNRLRIFWTVLWMSNNSYSMLGLSLCVHLIFVSHTDDSWLFYFCITLTGELKSVFQLNQEPLNLITHLYWISIHHVLKLRAALNNRCAWCICQSKSFADRQGRKLLRKVLWVVPAPWTIWTANWISVTGQHNGVV